MIRQESGRFPSVLRASAALPALLAACALALSGCVLLPATSPGMRPIEDRLTNFPAEALRTRAPAEIRWNERQIPFIVAENDRDAAYLLGAAHAHLRESQMELLRRVAQGRVSETAGPFATDVDRLLRTLDLDRAVPEMASSLPPETRDWIQAYCDGVNDFIGARPKAPPDIGLLGGGPREAWTVEDVLSIGRLASVDISWARLFREAQLGADEEGRAYLQRLRSFMDDGVPSFGPQTPTPLSWLFSLGRTGSNSFAVSGARASGEGAMIASDPHLGILLPNLFLVAGYRTPDGAVVGLTFPGLPFVVIGRNERIAWGGSNMLALSSVFYDVSDEPEEAFSRRAEPMRRRWWSNFTPTFRDHELGPVVTDAPFVRDLDLPDTAMWWRGHQPSDEATAFLKASRATDWASFREAFQTYAVSGQNMIYADAEGNIGQLMAVEYIPAAGRVAQGGLLGDPDDPDDRPAARVASERLPAAYNPETGLIVTANNVPFKLDPPVTLGGNWNDRTLRLIELLGEGEVTLDRLRAAQRDVYLISAHEAARAIVSRGALDEGPVLSALASWDGRYNADSRGALVYEAFARNLIDAHYRPRFGDEGARAMRSSHAAHRFIADDLTTYAVGGLTLRLVEERTREDLAQMGEGATWGDRHRLDLRHPVGYVPIIGRRFRFENRSAPGTTGTVYKTAHGVGARRHTITYGAQSRHVSDMSSLDENYFVLLGGQDGWLGSDQFLDQLALWESGRMVRVPLSEEAVRRTFRRVVRIEPGN